MKNSNLLLLITSLLFINICCSENENILNTENATISSTDSIIQPKIIVEKEDSLSKPLKYIYLTIDDGPLNGSKYIDSIISNHQIKTNLFVVGNAINGSSRFLKYYKMFQENPYIEIYNHSYSHANNRYLDFYKNPELVLADFEKSQTEFSIVHKIARLPGRNLWQIGERKKNYSQTGFTSAELLSEKGYKIYGWDVEWTYNPKDYTPKKSVDKLIEEIENSYNTCKTFTPNHVVLLMHDQMFAKINDDNNLGKLISKLEEHNFIFEHLSSYPENE